MHSIGREFQGLAVRGKLLISLSSKTKNACFIKSLNFGNVYIFERIFNMILFLNAIGI